MMILWKGAQIAGALLALAASQAAPAAAVGFDRAQALYENHCRTCHENWAHTRDGRVVDSLAALRARVASWSLHSGLNWSADDIDDVTAYLNRHFYHFDPMAPHRPGPP